MQSTVFGLVKCRDKRLNPLLTVHGEVLWSFSNTLAARVWGVEKAKWIWVTVFENRYGLAVRLVLSLAFAVMVVLAFFFPDDIGGLLGIKISVVVLTFTLLLELIAFGVFAIDLRIARHVVFSRDVWGKVGVSMVALLSISSFWDYDERTALSCLLVYVIFYITLLDSIPPQVRNMIAMPFLLLLFVSFFAVLVALSLGHFPGQKDNQIVSLGYFGGLSEREITLSVTQLAIDSTVVFTLLSIRSILQQWQNRKRGYLFSVSASICFSLEIEDDDKLFDFPLMVTNQFSSRDVPEHAINIPVYETYIFNLLNPKGEVKWQFKSCLAAQLLGEERARRYFVFLLRGKYTNFKMAMLFVILLAWAVISCMVMFFHVHNDVLRICYIVYSVVVYVLNFYVFSFFFDLRILRIVLKDFFFWGNVIASVILVLCVWTMYDFSYVGTLLIALPFLMVFAGAKDSFNFRIKRKVSLVILLVCILAYVVSLIMFQLGRFSFDAQTNEIVSLGTFNGLAKYPVLVNLAQVTTDIAIAEIILLSESLYHEWREPQKLINVRLPIVVIDDPTFHFFTFLPESFQGGGRRVSNFHLQTAMVNDHALTSENPNF